MALHPLPTPWNVFNLRSSPFWQESLGGGDNSHPLSLFVGRTTELKELESVLYGAGASSSRQAIAGAPGVGKTTLVKEFKARAGAQGYFTIDDFAALMPDDTPEGLFSRVLNLVYETILSSRPMTAGNPRMEAAQQLVRSGQVKTGRGAGVSLLGLGMSITQSSALSTPKSVLTDGVRILGDLIHLVRGADARGVLVHLNNLETLSEAAAAASADILRALRDPLLMHPGLHIVIVGTTEAVQTVVGTHPQLRTVFSTQTVKALDIADVHHLLAERYDHDRLDVDAPVHPPVDDTFVAQLHDLYRGDLRGLLKALDDGIRPNIGRAVTSHGHGVRPLTASDIVPTLKQRYTVDLDALKEKTRVEQLSVWGQQAPAERLSQAELKKLWNVSQGAVSSALGFLTREGYVLVLPREISGPTQYALSGISRLIFD